jgi:hypothetical protein
MRGDKGIQTPINLWVEAIGQGIRARGRAERTCNAQATDDRNWLRIETLELHAQTIRCEEAGFAMHVFQPEGSVLAALCMSYQPLGA